MDVFSTNQIVDVLHFNSNNLIKKLTFKHIWNQHLQAAKSRHAYLWADGSDHEESGWSPNSSSCPVNQRKSTKNDSHFLRWHFKVVEKRSNYSRRRFPCFTIFQCPVRRPHCGYCKSIFKSTSFLSDRLPWLIVFHWSTPSNISAGGVPPASLIKVGSQSVTWNSSFNDCPLVFCKSLLFTNAGTFIPPNGENLLSDRKRTSSHQLLSSNFLDLFLPCPSSHSPVMPISTTSQFCKLA